MDLQYIENWFSFGTVPYDGFSGKKLEVEKLDGFVNLGFLGPWTKVFHKRNGTGYNMLGKRAFGEFTVGYGEWDGSPCVVFDYGPGFIKVREYLRQVDPGVFIGVYEVGGQVKGWFLLKEAEKKCC